MKNMIRPSDLEIILDAVKNGKNSIYLLSLDEKIIMGISSIKQAVDRLVKHGCLEKGKKTARGKFPLRLTYRGEIITEKIKANPLPRIFNGSIGHLYYRIVEEYGSVCLWPVYHGSLPSNYKIEIGTP